MTKIWLIFTWVLIVVLIFQAQSSIKKIKELQEAPKQTMQVFEQPPQVGFEGICDLNVVVCADEKMEIVLQ